tara:strand:- start:839 stop:1738 length:900 start_codon:yes stop_codon:yes gene_type:complete
MESFYSHGKVLLSAEYLVLKGAKALALPTKLGQYLSFKKKPSNHLRWKSFDENGLKWFDAKFSIKEFKIITTDNLKVANRLRNILLAIRNQNPVFLIKYGGKIITRLEFGRYWGLGSSSTLIANLAKWSNVDPYILLSETFGGSGYDIACASAKKAIFYTRGIYSPRVEEINFNPSFKSDLYFIYLNQKINSRHAVKKMMEKKINDGDIKKADQFSKLIGSCETLSDFEVLLTEHEHFISQLISINPVKEKYFQDFTGAIKSIGAWGGDFILATGDTNTPKYFKKKGFSIVFGYSKLIY